ncbi:regulatory YrvL family protein [Oceanobacillus picturae]|uniref:regulatory YrvL family protein n=1 Tax=Oceanobacillus picturae TaxID=171693 RepID=UPI002174F19D|nr:regulatory YrvL family protein [Oceanobacillus picturae]
MSPFRDMNWKEKMASFIGITIFIIFLVGFVVGIYFFGIAGVFNLLGVEYDTVWSLVLFVISFYFLGIIVEILSKAIFKLTTLYIKGKSKVMVIRVCIEFTSNLLVLYTVDEFMSSITLSIKTEIIVAVLIAILEIAFEDAADKE